MRLLGIDFGNKRTGLAIGETGEGPGSLALPFEMFENLPNEQLAQAITRLVKREAIDAVVIGLPLHANGSPSQQSMLTERFIVTLQQTLGSTFPLHRYSEYLTSHDSEGKLAGHFTRMQKRQRIDAIAAARILQDFMDHHADGTV